jgi:hypothetical protein
MIDHLKTTNQTAIELLKNSLSNPDLELVGSKDLGRYSPAFANSNLDEKFHFKNIFGLNVNFCYVIQSICLVTNAAKLYERGIGYVYDSDGATFLKRVMPIFRGINQADCSINYSGLPLDFNCCDAQSYSFVTSTLPVTYFESLAVPNSVLCSSSPLVPQPVQIQQNSFLSRLDGDIESVDFEDERLVDKITKIISKFAKQLKLKTSKLSLKRVEPETIDMVPTSNVKAKRGSLYYDEQDDTLKIYNGQSWKTIAFLKD